MLVKLMDRIFPAILAAIASIIFWVLLDHSKWLIEILTSSELKLLGTFSITATIIITALLSPMYLKQFRQGDHLWFGIRPGITITFLSVIATSIITAFWLSLSNDLNGLSLITKLMEVVPLTIVILLTGTMVASFTALPIGLLCGHILWRYSHITQQS